MLFRSIVGAKTAARLGARVLLVERDRTVGDCLWTGCVPSKALLAAARVAARAREGHRDPTGVRLPGPDGLWAVADVAGPELVVARAD